MSEGMKVYRMGRMGRRLVKVGDGWLTQALNYVTGPFIWGAETGLGTCRKLVLKGL